MKSMARLGLAGLALAALALAAAVPSRKNPRQPRPRRATAAVMDDEKELNIYNWSDYIDASIIADFEKEYGIKVQLRRVRFQRDPGDQAAGRQDRL